MTKIAVYGWGLVAPGAEDIDEFKSRLEQGGTWLEPFHGFGPDAFLVGRPKFDFQRYEPFLTARFAPSKTKQLLDKMDDTTLFGIASFIQALQQNPGLEAELQALQDQAHVYVANALGAFPTIFRTSIELYRAQRRWNRFWSHPERNAALREHLAGNALESAPTNPERELDPETRESLEDDWFAFWAARSDALQDYLQEFRQIESPAVEGDVEKGKMKLMRDKRRQLSALKEKWQAPEPPWNEVSANVLWNIPNTPASQISMIGKITGLAVAPVAACSTFGVALKMGMDAIARGDAKLAVIGSVDPPPHPLTVGAFYSARVLSADGQASKPLTGLKGTHVAGGGCIWIIGDAEYGKSRGFKPLGLQPLAVGVSSDADHIITPSEEGPRAAMRQALDKARVDAKAIRSWDLHATATPGDAQELANLQSVIPKSAKVTARKGTFGHGMGVGGGWELTAQYLGVESGKLYPTALDRTELNPTLAEMGQELVFDATVKVPPGPVGKLSMGVGGINACVISQPHDE